MNLDKDKVAGKFVKRHETIKAHVDKVNKDNKINDLMTALARVNYDLKNVGCQIDLSKEWEVVAKQYPLLKHVDRWSIRNDKPALEEYMNMIDILK